MSTNGSTTEDVTARIHRLAEVHKPRPVPVRPVPTLPAQAALQEPSGDRFPWLRDYIAYSRTWSPRSPTAMHEAVALWVLSTAAAGRVVYHDGKKRRASLYQMVVAPSTLYAKTSCAEIGADVLKAAGLGDLLLRRGGPQAQFLSMVLRVPPDYHTMPSPQREEVRQRLAFKAQRGWLADEFGVSLAAMQNERSHMAELSKMLLEIDGGPAQYEADTIARGPAELLRPTLSLLALSTPAQMAAAMKRHDRLWNDGTLARCAFVAVAPDEQPNTKRWPNGERILPNSVVRQLQTMHGRLGRNEVSVEAYEQPATDGSGKKDKATPFYQATVTCWAEYEVTLSDDLLSLSQTYEDSLHRLMTTGSVPETLYAPYGRFVDRGKRIACLLAAIECQHEATADHWAKAQAIVERGRECLHWVYNSLSGDSIETTPIDRVCQLLEARGPMTIRQMQQHLKRQPWAQTTAMLERELTAMIDAGADVHRGQVGRKTLYAVRPIAPPTTTERASQV